MKLEGIGEYGIHQPTSGGKAGKNRNATSTIQVRRENMVVKQFRYAVEDGHERLKALARARDFCNGKKTDG